MLLYQTHAVVDLGKIEQNIKNIRSHVGCHPKILLALKANAYGHGAVRVAMLGEKIGLDYLGIATVLEAIELRQAGIKLPILKFSPVFEQEMHSAILNNLSLTICEFKNAQLLQTIAKDMGAYIKVHLKVDTGMGRIGVTPLETPKFAHFIQTECPNLQIEGIFTHLPVSDSPSKVQYTQAQLELFKTLVTKTNKELKSEIPLVHAANSGGVLGHPQSWMSMIRPGISIYGLLPDPATVPTIDLLPALSLYTKISFIKKVCKGTPIGYGATWCAKCDTFIATIPIGYADGFNRLFSNKGKVIIDGKLYPIVGRVCMDQCTIDLGPQTELKVGDLVVLIGTQQNKTISVLQWAKMLKTISYEITCQISARVPRVYI